MSDFSEGQPVLVTGPGGVDKRKFVFVRDIQPDELTPSTRLFGGKEITDYFVGFAFLPRLGRYFDKDAEGNAVEVFPYANSEWCIVHPVPAGRLTSSKLVPVQFIKGAGQFLIEVQSQVDKALGNL